MDKVIAKSELLSWLKSLVERYRVIGPVEQDKGPAAYQDIDGTSEIVLGNDAWTMAPREYLLPREEILFSVRDTGDGPNIKEPDVDQRPTLLAGLRLCDAKAVHVLDKVYLTGQFRDPYYAARRESATLVGVVCTTTRWSCFCTSVGGPLDWVEYLDATMTDIGDKIHISSRTEKGDALLAGSGLSEPTEDDAGKKEAVWRTLAATPMQSFAGKDIPAMLDWDHAAWDEIAKRCLACGICNYLCPSCSCFDIQDEAVATDCVERFRCRDTCQFSDFTRMGAGHNPREAQVPRTRQRIMHKFKYQMEQHGTYGCTGCGRCIEGCPVNIDVREIFAAMLAAEEQPQSGINEL